MNNLILIGSRALVSNFYHLSCVQKVENREAIRDAFLAYRNPNDMDLVGDYDTLRAHMTRNGDPVRIIDGGSSLVTRHALNGAIEEGSIAWDTSTNKELVELVMNDPKSLNFGLFKGASLDVLYMLKMSHRFKKNSIHFKKTMDDILLMRALGATIPEEYQGFYKRRVKETYNYPHPKLNQSKGEFFTDEIPYKYDHDSIHEVVAILDRPAYTYFKPEDSEVMVSKVLWDNLSDDIKRFAVWEEATVLAIERAVAPHNTPDERAFQMALEKVCTSITSGWFRSFAYDNYYQVMEMTKELPSPSHLLGEGLERGIIQPYKGKTHESIS